MLCFVFVIGDLVGCFWVLGLLVVLCGLIDWCLVGWVGVV